MRVRRLEGAFQPLVPREEGEVRGEHAFRTREGNLGHKTSECRTKKFSSALILDEVESMSDFFIAQ
jgi:hypothetical protein